MGIKLTNVEQVKRYVRNYEKRQHDIMRNRLHRVGLNFVTEARSKIREDGYYSTKGAKLTPDSQGFHDQTAVLRSSIGYIITYNGFPLDFNFDGKSSEGVAEAKNFANELVGNTEGFSLICVAGANYAFWVEENGYDVITGSSITAEQTLRKWFK